METIGKKVVRKIESGYKKDAISNNGIVLEQGYEELYLHKFKTYLGSVSRKIMNQNLMRKGWYDDKS